MTPSASTAAAPQPRLDEPAIARGPARSGDRGDVRIEREPRPRAEIERDGGCPLGRADGAYARQHCLRVSAEQTIGGDPQYVRRTRAPALEQHRPAERFDQRGQPVALD